VGDNTLVSARLLDHKPAALRPFEEVSAAIVRQLTQQQAAQLAAKEGRDMLARLRQGEEVAVKWSTAKLVSRETPQGVEGPVLNEAFKLDAARLPAYSGVENGQGGFSLVKVTRVIDAESVDAAKRNALGQQLRQLRGQEEFSAYVASLKLGADVKVNKERMERKEQ
jgi:peptidyl-prolyl cis-trans isomerase D